MGLGFIGLLVITIGVVAIVTVISHVDSGSEHGKDKKKKKKKRSRWAVGGDDTDSSHDHPYPRDLL